MFQRPKRPPVTAPQPSVSGYSSAPSRPKNPPATAPMRAEVYLGSDSLGITIAEGLDILWTFLTELPLKDYEQAACVYKNWRLHPKYSTLEEDASEADREWDDHKRALDMAIKEAKTPSTKYSVEGPSAAPSVYSYVPVYSFLVSPPMPEIERPVAPPRFIKRALLWEQEEELGLEIEWKIARNDAAALMRLQERFVKLYQPYYCAGDVRPKLASDAAPAVIGSPVARLPEVIGPCGQALPPPSAATIRMMPTRCDRAGSDASSLPLDLSSVLPLNNSRELGAAEVPSASNVAACPSPSSSCPEGARGDFDNLSPLLFSVHGTSPLRTPHNTAGMSP